MVCLAGFVEFLHIHSSPNLLLVGDTFSLFAPNFRVGRHILRFLECQLCVHLDSALRRRIMKLYRDNQLIRQV
jgi:hypothetical protein